MDMQDVVGERAAQDGGPWQPTEPGAGGRGGAAGGWGHRAPAMRFENRVGLDWGRDHA
jgi:hypothetical protein